MKRVATTFFLFAYTMTAVGLSDSAKEAKITYNRIAAQVRAGDPTADWKALRFAAESTDLFGHFDPSAAESKMYAAFSKKDYAAALEQANAILQRDIADGTAHYFAMLCYEKLGDKVHFDSEAAMVKAIAHSIMDDSSGKSAETAWVTASVHEEYFILHVLGVRPAKQSLINKDGKSFDLMHAVDSSDPNRELDLWFDTTFAMQKEAKLLKK